MKHIAGLIILSLLISSASADVLVKLADDVTLLAENGKTNSSSGTFLRKEKHVLSNGINQLLVRYSAEVKGARNDRSLEQTDAFVILFSASDEQLVLAAPSIKSHSDLEKFNRSGGWKLINEQGFQLDIKEASLKYQGFQLNRDYEEELAKFNLSNSSAAYSTAPGNPLKSESEIGGAPLNGMEIQMLKYWYRQADIKTRNQFENWVLKTQ